MTTLHYDKLYYFDRGYDLLLLVLFPELSASTHIPLVFNDFCRDKTHPLTFDNQKYTQLLLT